MRTQLFRESEARTCISLHPKVYGPSMLPTMSVTGDCVFEESLSINVPALRPLKRGDLVVLTSPLDPRAHICKRVLGLPGDVICVDPTGEYAPSTEHVVIPKGYLWIVGDNASMSRDSRVYGPVPMALVRGRVVARVRLQRVVPPSRSAHHTSASDFAMER